MTKTFAVLSGNCVTNVIAAETLADAELATKCVCVEFSSENPAYVGAFYDAKTNTFNETQVVEPSNDNSADFE